MGLFRTLKYTPFMLVCAACTQGAGSGANFSNSAKLVVANAVMRDEAPQFASPSQGGLVGSLYIEPRDQMSAPDTQTVGCDQRGSGALGIDSYLSQPSWITQQVLLTDVDIPARYFLQGFPSASASGAVVPVDSYFAISAIGNFHLLSTDAPGDYQFALAADDGAQLQVGSLGQGYSMAVDDEKPPGPNGTCLEQTQPVHMSCTTNWSDQSASNVVTYHLEPGQIIPIQLTYWQGPGQALGLLMFYRRVADKTNSADLTDSVCGTQPDFSQNGSGLKDVLTRWTPVTWGNLNAIPLE